MEFGTVLKMYSYCFITSVFSNDPLLDDQQLNLALVLLCVEDQVLPVIYNHMPIYGNHLAWQCCTKVNIFIRFCLKGLNFGIS